MSEEISYLLLLISPNLLISYSCNLLEEWIEIQWKFFNYHIPCLCWIPATLSNIWSNISWPIFRKIQIDSLDVNNQHSWTIDNGFGYNTIFYITPKVSRTINEMVGVGLDHSISKAVIKFSALFKDWQIESVVFLALK